MKPEITGIKRGAIVIILNVAISRRECWTLGCNDYIAMLMSKKPYSKESP